MAQGSSHTAGLLKQTAYITTYLDSRVKCNVNFENFHITIISFVFIDATNTIHFKCNPFHFWATWHLMYDQKWTLESPLEFLDISWDIGFSHKHQFWVTFTRSAHSHFTTKPPRDLLYVLKWTLGSPQEVLDVTWVIGWHLEAI